MERTAQSQDTSQEAQKIFSQFKNCQEILMLAQELGAERIVISKGITNF